jgi:hypothetical protein
MKEQDTEKTTILNTEDGKTLAQAARDIVTAEPVIEDTRNNGELLKEHGLKVVHIRPDSDVFAGRGMTVAYRDVNRNVIEIATAIVHTTDTFTKKIGTRIAVENFIAGRTVFVRKLRNTGYPVSSAESLQLLFGA